VAYIEHLPWQECIAKYDREHTFFYCDPPYWNTEGYGVDFGFDQYEEIAELAKTIKGKMIVSINDIPEIREVFKGLKRKSVAINYTVGRKGRSERKELIIRSW